MRLENPELVPAPCRGRAKHLAGHRDLVSALQKLRQAKISYQGSLIVLVDEDVVWLEIAVQDASLVGCFNGPQWEPIKLPLVGVERAVR